jgi:hypothetical protein
MKRDVLHDVPSEMRVSMDPANDDARYWRFERNSRLPRNTFARDPMDVFIRYRGWVLVAGIVVLILIALTGADLPNL